MTIPAVAGEFPDRPVKIIVQTAAGSALDVTARLIAEPLSQLWGQQAIIINQAGGGRSYCSPRPGEFAGGWIHVFSSRRLGVRCTARTAP
jgi:hypothetical protein